MWWDRSIPPGQDFGEVIEEALHAAKCVVVLWSKESVKSEWVRNEARVGLQRGILIPALIEAEVTMPLEFRLRQAADLIDWKASSPHTGYDSLVSSIAAILSRPKS